MPPVGERATIKAAQGMKQQVADALPGTLAEITAKSGVKRMTVVRWLRIMRDSGECHVGKWKRSAGSGPLMRVYVAGKGVDAKRPERLSMAVYKQRYRQRHPLEVDIYNARRRAISEANRAARTPQNWASALMGATL